MTLPEKKNAENAENVEISEIISEAQRQADSKVIGNVMTVDADTFGV